MMMTTLICGIRMIRESYFEPFLYISCKILKLSKHDYKITLRNDRTDRCVYIVRCIHKYQFKNGNTALPRCRYLLQLLKWFKNFDKY